MKKAEKKEIVQECFNQITEAMQKFVDAEDRLKECGIEFCSYKFPQMFGKRFSVQVFKGIEVLAECIGEKCDHPWECGEPQLNTLSFTKGDVRFYELGEAGGYTFR